MSKTSAAFQIKIMRDALAQGIMPYVTLRGQTERYPVRAVKNHGHSLTLTLDRAGGHLILDPEEMQSVWVPQLPAKPTPEDESIYEVRVDD